jgi:hypothetical protein
MPASSLPILRRITDAITGRPLGGRAPGNGRNPNRLSNQRVREPGSPRRRPHTAAGSSPGSHVDPGALPTYRLAPPRRGRGTLVAADWGGGSLDSCAALEPDPPAPKKTVMTRSRSSNNLDAWGGPGCSPGVACKSPEPDPLAEPPGSVGDTGRVSGAGPVVYAIRLCPGLARELRRARRGPRLCPHLPAPVSALSPSAGAGLGPALSTGAGAEG